MRIRSLWMGMILGLGGCAASQEELAWRVARDSNSPSDYENYMRQYPSGTHAREARWEAARRAGTISAYLDYLKKDSQSGRLDEIRERIDAAAEKDLSVYEASAYLAYCRDYVKNPSKKAKAREAAVRAKLEEREWTQARDAKALAPLVFFVRKYPASSHATEAQELIQSKRFEAARALAHPFAYRGFLATYGKGERADEMRALLAKAEEPASSDDASTSLDSGDLVRQLAEKDAAIGRQSCSLLMADRIRRAADPAQADAWREKMAALEAEQPLPAECAEFKGVSIDLRDPAAVRAVKLFLHGRENLAELASRYKAMAQRTDLVQRSVKAADVLSKQLETDELSEGVLGGGALGGVDLGLSEKGSVTALRARERLEVLQAAATAHTRQAEKLLRRQGGQAEAVRFYLTSILKLEQNP